MATDTDPTRDWRAANAVSSSISKAQLANHIPMNVWRGDEEVLVKTIHDKALSIGCAAFNAAVDVLIERAGDMVVNKGPSGPYQLRTEFVHLRDLLEEWKVK